LAAQITRLPLSLGFDAAILFSDILVLSEVFGFTIDFIDGKGIQLLEPLKEIKKDTAETLSYVAEAIHLLKKDLAVPLIGFCGGPYTVSKYMKRTTIPWLEKITQASIEYLQMQIRAGVDVIQIFDSWAGTLEPPDFHHLALPYLKTLVESVKNVPVIIFCRGSCRYVKELVSLHPAAIGFDTEKEMQLLRKEVPPEIAIQGNLDPAILKGPLDVLQQKATALLHSMKNVPGYIFNLGHGVEPETPVENVKWLIKYVKDQGF
ncbi:MAG: uroporphyrinogen decarboxylase family protein, partial [Thermodesulfobacteriota bacterium]